jgi:hypothetical protein
MKLGIIATTITATALGVGLLTAPAYAERAYYPDPADASASLTDIRGVTVDHGPSRLVVKVRFADLRRRSTGGPSGLAILINTRMDRKGAEFLLTTGLQSGTDYQLVRMRRGKVVGEPLSCAHKVVLDFDADRLRFRAARACLDTPESVSVSVKMRDEWDSSHPVTDWLGEPRSYTNPLVSS